MRIRSLAYETDFLVIAETGRVDHRPDYSVGRTPENPGYLWGNLILMPEPPQAGDLTKWTEIFAREFEHETGVRHQTFGWDSPSGEDGAAAEFVQAGFERLRSDVLIAETLDLRPPPEPADLLEMRPLESNGDWEKATELQILCRGAGFDPSEFRDFKVRRMRAFRRLVEEDRGRWYGAFLGDQLVGDLGLFSFDGTARFQLIETHPDHRRRGVCRNLLYFSAHDFLLTGDADTLMIVAEEDSAESKIYQSVGFKVGEKQIGLCRMNSHGES